MIEYNDWLDSMVNRINTVNVYAHVRYWEDGEVNGVEDVDGMLIPCREGDCWCPKIDIHSGQILNWEQGKVASIHYKVCDGGTYKFVDDEGNNIFTLEHTYVPKLLSTGGDGYGDYIIMEIDSNGYIQHWKGDLDDVKSVMKYRG